jgi:thioredoxin-related protein
MIPGLSLRRHGLLLLALLWLPLARAADGDAFFDQTLGDFPAELQAARATARKGLLLMFEAEGCPYCRRMRSDILSRREVQDFFRSRFAIFAIDILGDVALTDPAGRETTEKRWAREQRIRATPTFVFIGLDGRETTRHTGALQTAEDFLKLGQFVAEGHYLQQTFEQFHPDQRSTRRKP